SYNQLCDIPESIGFLYQLEILVLSHNQIQSIPDTIGLLSQLYELDLSYNQIQQLTPFTSQLKSLHVFDISHNRLVTLTSRIGEIQTLASLDISYNNQLNYLPAEIIQLPSLRRLDLDGCVSFSLHHHHHHHLKHDPPSLLETCARYIVRNEDQFVSNDSHSIQSKITTRLFNYLCQYERCSHCHLPYFESYISKIRWIERNETMWIPIEYRLCSAHWIDERDRLYTTFSTS
ncbi:uncharacterized protein BX663DRAFT_403067, partial [Cokeromyces recurvatus]|uniref:uncharacterized protein n=1 Tax=Cokeromyces recurvatus TaxID=90255 RepID=UPI00222083E7